MYTENKEPTIAGNQLSREYWMTDQEFKDCRNSMEQFQSYCDKYKNHELMQEFAKDKFVDLVYYSNRQENTLPIGTKKGDIAKLLQDKPLKDNATPTVKEWNADGKSPQYRTQMVNHKEAYEHLISNRNLTMKVILDTHGILMKGALSDDGKPISNGKLRRINVNNGVDNYMPYAEVKEELSELIKAYKDCNSDPIMEASNLFWKFLQIHPFEDGNGRVARLLVAFCLYQSGTPFPVTITSGKCRSLKHYNHAIKRQQYVCSKINPLYNLIAYSVNLGWKNFFSLIRK